MKKNLSNFFNNSKTSSFLFILFGFFLPISPSISSIIIFLLFLLFFFSKNKISRIKKVFKQDISKEIILFFLFIIISSLWFKKFNDIIDLNSSFIYELNKIWLLLICPFLFLFNFENKIKKRAKNAFILGLLTTALFSFINYIFPYQNFLFKTGHYNDKFYLQGFIDHSDLSIFFCFGIFLVLNEMIKRNKINYKLCALIIIFITFLLNSYGRTGIICFLILFPLFIYLKYSWNKNLLIIKFFTLLILILSFIFSESLSTRFSNTITELNDIIYGVSIEEKIYRHAMYMAKKDPSKKSIEFWEERILNEKNKDGEPIWLNHVKNSNNHKKTSIGKRIYLWKNYVQEISNHKILGHGLGSVNDLKKQTSISLNPHNYYLFILKEGGIIGLLLLVNIFYSMIKKYINNREKVLKIIFPLLLLFALFINDYLFIYNTLAFFGFFSFIIYSDSSS